MRRTLLVILVLALAGLGLWGYFGGVEEVTQRRVEAALVDACLLYTSPSPRDS